MPEELSPGEPTPNRLELIKAHFRDHRELYFGLVGGAVLGVTAAQRVQIANSFNLFYKSQVEQIAIQSLARRGHPGNVIRCIETGETFASQNRAAEVLGIAKSQLSQHLNGKQNSVAGKTFEILGEAVA